jgi:hypothetical protein
MPSHDAKRASAKLSRRSLLQGAATAGAAGLAATALGAAANPALAATSGRPAGRSSAAGQPRSGGEGPASSGPVVVHVRNAKSGDIEVFSGTSQNRLRDKDLAARIARAIG